MTVKRALICAPLVPEFDRESGAQNILDCMMFLRDAGWAVSFASENPNGGIGTERYARLLSQQGIATYLGFDERFERLIEFGRLDLVICAFWYVAERVLPIVRHLSPQTRVIVSTIDLHLLRNSRRTLRDFDGSGAQGLLDVSFAVEMAREINVYAAADGALCVSGREVDLVNDLVCDPTRAHLAPDYEELPPSPVPFTERSGALFIGNFRHPPNAEAVEYLCREVVPLLDPALLIEHPIYIVGNSLDERVRAFGKGLPSVRMVGWVPSVVPYLHRARISIVPLLHGAGTKRKLLQALVAGTPSVSTTIGAEGFDLRDGEHILIADTPREFAESIARLLQDEALWQRVSRAGRDRVAHTYSREAARARFMTAISAVLAKAPRRVDLVQPADVGSPRQQYRRLVERIRAVVRDELPPEATVMVVSRGDDELLKLDGRTGWHFPGTDDGRYAGHHPADGAEAVSLVEKQRAKGGQFLVFPETARWWLDHYVNLKEHLDRAYRLVADREGTCLIYALQEPAMSIPSDDSTAGTQAFVVNTGR